MEYAPVTISEQQFKDLKAGELVLWRGKYLRTVMEPAKHKAITLAIRTKSWTGRATTVYFWTDVKKLIKPVGKSTRGLMLKSEVLVLKGLGHNIRKQLKRELKEHKERAIRMNRPICQGFARLERFV